MRAKFFTGAILAVLLFGFTRGALAHGVGWRRVDSPAVALEFFYSTGDSMAYQEARVFSPVDAKFSWLSGRTDEKGRFAFVPDVSGMWRVVVKDDEGHLAEAELEIEIALPGSGEDPTGQAGVNASAGTLPQGTELAVRAILGVSLLFNIAMAILLHRRGRV